MKKNSSLLFVSLLALVLAGCNSSPSKKKKSSGAAPISSVSGQSGAAPTSSQVNPSSGAPVSAYTSGGKPSSPEPISYNPPVPPTEGYEQCEEAFGDRDKESLLTALRSYTSQGHAGEYGDLWDTYKTVYIREDGKMFDYYSCTTNYTPGKDQAGSYSKEGDVYNREHSIPKSWWGGAQSNQGADPYIVVPTDGYINGIRGNFSFGMVQNVDKESNLGYSKRGTSDPAWSTTDHLVFEPNDSVKGDFARIYFYAIARYSNSYNWTEDDDAGLCFTGKNDDNFGFTDYAVKLLSYWNELDPVSEWEVTVSNRCEPIHGCRNPFVDHPEYANLLWGENPNYTWYTYTDN